MVSKNSGKRPTIEGEHKDEKNCCQEGNHEVSKKRGKRITLQTRDIMRLARRGVKRYRLMAIRE